MLQYPNVPAKIKAAGAFFIEDSTLFAFGGKSLIALAHMRTRDPHGRSRALLSMRHAYRHTNKQMHHANVAEMTPYPHLRTHASSGLVFDFCKRTACNPLMGISPSRVPRGCASYVARSVKLCPYHRPVHVCMCARVHVQVHQN